jgi:hypothetical protein
MRKVHVAALVSVAAGCVFAIGGIAGCNDGTDFRAGGLGGDESSAAATAAGANAANGSGAAAGCGGAPAPAPEKLPDPATLPACSPACGGAHCVPTDKVPAESRPSFAQCATGYCLPDELIASNGAKPPSCKSLGGADGVCLGPCIPQVADNKDILPKSTCAGDDLCAPCVNPQDGKDTGACAIGTQAAAPAPAAAACTPANPGSAPGSTPTTTTPAGPDLSCPHVGAPVIDPATLPACGAPGTAAHCLPGHVTPPDLASKLATCDGGFCVPDKLIASGGRFIPKTCSSIGNAEGRCESIVIPGVASQAHVEQGDCDPDERCVPCTNPLDGTDTGACKTSCDPGPKSPPVIFPACCGNQAKCIPVNLIPPGQSSHLMGAGCPGGSLCVPNENLDPNFVAPQCSADGFLGFSYDGSCVSNCVDLGDALDFDSQGSCAPGHTCIGN